jgi:SAM-dependent methyltransferase
MLNPKWNDSKIKSKAIKAGIDGNHKYLDRARTIEFQKALIEKYLSDYTDGADSRTVLDISTGTGVLVELMNDLGHQAKGTEIPDSPYTVFHKSQKIDVEYFDVADIPFPVKEKFDLVTCIGAFNEYPEEAWSKIFKEILKIADKTVLIGITKGEAYDRNSRVFTKPLIKGWELTEQNGTFYRWDKE